jgi:hypothetical protein
MPEFGGIGVHIVAKNLLLIQGISGEEDITSDNCKMCNL